MDKMCVRKSEEYQNNAHKNTRTLGWVDSFFANLPTIVLGIFRIGTMRLSQILTFPKFTSR